MLPEKFIEWDLAPKIFANENTYFWYFTAYCASYAKNVLQMLQIVKKILALIIIWLYSIRWMPFIQGSWKFPIMEKFRAQFSPINSTIIDKELFTK